MRLITYNDVAARLGVSRATAERMVLRADLPAPIVITPGSVRFIEDEINAWLAARPRTSGKVQQ